MEEIKKNAAALLKVKTIVTLIVIIVFAVLALTGVIQPDSVMNVVLMVVAFYFGTQTEKKNAAAVTAPVVEVIDTTKTEPPDTTVDTVG